ncbi:MAG TPA: GntR family transcriptional regulator [Gammaproteobacteria bacterium]|jgi:GntR family transcriptional regulator
MMIVQKRPLRLSIDLDSPVAVARQIADGLRVLLVRGALKAGDDLPSSRRLATELAVHFNTVAEAYRELEREGWLELRRKQGTLVRERPQPQPSRSERDTLQADFTDELERLLSRYQSRGLSTVPLSAALRDAARDIKGEK